MQRKLAAILAADVVGYSRLMEERETETLAAMRWLRTAVMEPAVVQSAGRIFKTTGDGFFAEFESALAAVECAVSIQSKLGAAEAVPEGRLSLRLAVNLGDVVIEDGDLFGDGVNVAARLETVAQPGSVCLAFAVYDQVHRKLDLRYEDIGPQTLKNIAEPVFAVLAWPNHSATLPSSTLKVRDRGKPSVAVLPFENLSGDPNQTYFSDGITDDIITELSRFRSLFVIARNSSFKFSRQACRRHGNWSSARRTAHTGRHLAQEWPSYSTYGPVD
jgi:class 3 adenylate cyclase